MVPAVIPPNPTAPVVAPADSITSAGTAGRIPAGTPAPSTAAATPCGPTRTREV